MPRLAADLHQQPAQIPVQANDGLHRGSAESTSPDDSLGQSLRFIPQNSDFHWSSFGSKPVVLASLPSPRNRSETRPEKMHGQLLLLFLQNGCQPKSLGEPLRKGTQTRDYCLPEGVHLGPRHVVTALLGVGGKDEDMVDTRFVPGPIQSGQALLRCAE